MLPHRTSSLHSISPPVACWTASLDSSASCASKAVRTLNPASEHGTAVETTGFPVHLSNASLADALQETNRVLHWQDLCQLTGRSMNASCKRCQETFITHLRMSTWPSIWVRRTCILKSPLSPCICTNRSVSQYNTMRVTLTRSPRTSGGEKLLRLLSVCLLQACGWMHSQQHKDLPSAKAFLAEYTSSHRCFALQR